MASKWRWALKKPTVKKMKWMRTKGKEKHWRRRKKKMSKSKCSNSRNC